ncbi:uncharacterized protein LOC126278492 [Schistocerca gregaria]|uniref:uncharacterized protein LOC126278492 n=1 Tax=Schistocerca gregaria TaxID=7010 RepID=UPI00211F3F9D|nr:uncharacterized protein LOC126278492 [Schistocerca gregaria]
MAASMLTLSASACLLVVAALTLVGPPTAAAAAQDYSKHLQCVSCGPHSALINPILLAMFLLLEDLIGNLEVALCLTLHIFYISIIILQNVLEVNLEEIISGLVVLLEKVSNEPQYNRILELTGLLLTGVFSCVLSSLENALIW